MLQALIKRVLFAASLLAIPGQAVFAANATTGAGDSRTALILAAVAIAIVLGLLTRHHSMRFVNRLVERSSKQKLRRVLQRVRLDSIDNFVLPATCGGLTRIDSAVLTSAGIVCIRSKQVNGIIFANPGDPQWTVIDGVARQQLLNPIIQNDGRVAALRRVLPEMPVFNLVVFTGRTRFSVSPADNVIHVSGLASWLQQFQEQHESAQNHDDAWLSLRAAALTDDASLRDFEAQLSFG